MPLLHALPFSNWADNVCSCYPWTKSTRLWLTVGPAVTPEVFSTSSKSDSFCVLQYEDHQHLFQHPTSWLIRAPTISSFQNSPAAHKFTSYSQIHQLLINFQHHFPPLQIQWPISTYQCWVTHLLNFNSLHENHVCPLFNSSCVKLSLCQDYYYINK